MRLSAHFYVCSVAGGPESPGKEAKREFARPHFSFASLENFYPYINVSL